MYIYMYYIIPTSNIGSSLYYIIKYAKSTNSLEQNFQSSDRFKIPQDHDTF